MRRCVPLTLLKSVVPALKFLFLKSLPSAVSEAVALLSVIGPDRTMESDEPGFDWF